MIKRYETDIPIEDDIYASLYDSSDNLVDSFKIDDINNISDTILKRGIVDDKSMFTFFIKYETRKYISSISVDQKIFVLDVNRKKNEVSVKGVDIRIEDSRPLYISTNSGIELVVSIDYYKNLKEYVLVIENGIGDITTGSTIELYYVGDDTEKTEFLFTSNISATRPTTILGAHTTKDLVNFDISHPNNNNTEKTYGELQGEKFNINSKYFNNFNSYINVDFGDYNNFVKYSSAFSKIKSFDNKMNSLIELEALKTKNSGGGSQNIDNRIEELFNNFTAYENYLYENKYKDETTQNYKDWLETAKEESELYDLQNDEFILYLFPADIIEDDTTGYFTNFILLMGEFFDNIYLYVGGITDLKETNFTSDRQIITSGVKDALYDFGIKNKTGFDHESISDYFSGDDNLKKVSDIISRRLLYTIPQIYKSKGTTRVIQEIINVFGIPDDILSIYEIGSITDDEVTKVFSDNFNWYIDKTSVDTVTINVTAADIGDDMSLEFMVNNFDSDGNLITFDADNYIAIESNGSKYRINIFKSGLSVYQTTYFIEDNDNWTYIGITLDSLGNGKIYSYQQDKTGYGIINEYTDTFTWNFNGLTFQNIELFEDADISFTEFRIFNSVLSELEVKSHAQDFRSIAEQDYPSTCLVRFKAYNPIDDYTSMKAVVGDYVVSLPNTISSDIKKDQFFNYSEISYLFSEMSNNEFIRVDEKTKSSNNLSKIKVNEYKYDMDDKKQNIVGTFLSLTEKLNEEIIRRAGNFVEYIPSEYDENTYTFSNLTSLEKYLGDTQSIYNGDYILSSLYKLINKNLFSTIKSLLPISVRYESGILIRNNILVKNRSYKYLKTATYDPNYRLTVELNRGGSIVYDNDLNLGYVDRKIKSSGFANKNAYEGEVVYTNEAIESKQYQISIKNDELKVEYYVNSTIGGKEISDNETTILENAGATIIVR